MKGLCGSSPPSTDDHCSCEQFSMQMRQEGIPDNNFNAYTIRIS